MVLEKIRAGLKRRKLDALLVSQPDNRHYLSGYTAHDTSIAESSGLLLIPAKGTPFLLTDSRFLLQAEKEAPDFTVRLYQNGLLALLKELLPKLGVRRLGFESHWTLHSFADRLANAAKGLKIELLPLSGLIEKERLCKSAAELLKIEASVKLNEEVFQQAFATMRPGQTERQVAGRIETLMRERGAQSPSFETIVAAGPNSALPHAVPSDRPIQAGEPIVIDMGLILDGYCSDMTRTVVLGQPDAKMVKISRIVRQAQLAATKIIRAGVTGREVDQAARRVIKEAGYGQYFGHGLGHGVGLAVHEGPSLNRSNRCQLRPGMVVTVEPGIYLEGWGGIRLENMVVVEEKGARLLNTDPTCLDL